MLFSVSLLSILLASFQEKTHTEYFNNFGVDRLIEEGPLFTDYVRSKNE